MATTGARLPWQLVDERIRSDPARPLLTAYTDPPADPGAADRIDLTGASWANWVSKTANLLLDGLALDVDADPVPIVAVRLPPHWQVAVWADAVNRVGARLVGSGSLVRPGPLDPDDPPAVAVTTTAGAAAALSAGAGEVVVAPMLAMNAPAPGPLPDGALDYAAEVGAHGDRFVPPPREPRPEDEAVVAAAAALVDTAGLTAGTRLLSAGTVVGSPWVELLAVATVGGSLVLSPDAGSLTLTDRAARWQAEQVTAVVPADRHLWSSPEWLDG